MAVSAILKLAFKKFCPRVSLNMPKKAISTITNNNTSFIMQNKLPPNYFPLDYFGFWPSFYVVFTFNTLVYVLL